MSDLYFSETLPRLKQIAGSAIPADDDYAFIKKHIGNAVCGQFFFERLKNQVWLDWLIEIGCYNAVPQPEKLDNGNVQWPELQYLKNICAEVPDRVVDILVGLPQTDNRSVHHDIVDIAAIMPPEKSVRLAPKVSEFIGSKSLFGLYTLFKVLGKWAKVASFDQLEGILSTLLKFNPDPAEDEKIQRRKENPEDYFTSLEPQPFMHSHEYKKFIEDILPALLQTMPFQMGELLIRTTARMIDLKMHPEQRKDKNYTDDWSEIWCRRLIDNKDSLDRSPELLVQALTLSCEAVYEQDSENIQKLDQQLEKQRRKVFERIRQHLFGKYPDRADKTAIRKYILEYPHYDEYSYGFEFQQMLRAACIHFGEDLLTEPEREKIFEAILSGPSKDSFMEWMGDRYTEDSFEQRKNYLHRQQLLPFRPVLFGKSAERLQELDAVANEKISDDDYSPVGKSRGGTISQISPKPKDELLKLGDPALLDFINNWNDVHRAQEDWFKEINIAGLSLAFQSACSESILKEPGRIAFWRDSLNQIQRPVYVRALIAAMRQIIEEGFLEHLSTYFGFCEEILNLPQLKEESSFRGDESDAEPKDWTSSRRAVCDLVASCLSEKAEVPVDYGAEILGLLEQLCTQPDLDMDQGRSIIVSEERHPFTDAINYARGRAWEQLFEYAAWKRKHDEAADLSDVWEVIRKRTSPDCEIPLTLPEYAMLGRCYVRFFIFKEQSVAEELKLVIFPPDKQDEWSVAFTNFLAGSRPHPEFFNWFKEDYVRALESFGEDLHVDWDHLNLVESVGDRLFLYYMWDLIPEEGLDALLKRYYVSTEFNPAFWEKLFQSIGFKLGRTKEPLAKELEDRVHSFVKWRVSKGCKKELTGFIRWLEAEHLDQSWLLGTFSEILDLIADEEFDLMFTFEALERNTEVCLDRVLECLQKITARLEGKYIHFSEEPVQKILQAGLSNRDPEIVERARCCRENLLKARDFRFLEMAVDRSVCS